MKKVFTILVLAGVCLAACQKDAVTPAATTTTPVSTKSTSSITTTNQGTPVDDTTKGYIRVQLAKDSINTDDILIDFNPTAKAAYNDMVDARTFAGFGEESLSSLSSDGVALAIYTLPLMSQGTTIGLVVNAKTTGIYKLNLPTISAIPSSFDIWLKDKYKKDSLNFRLYPSYAFNLTTTDTSTYGSNRFTIVLRAH